MNYQENRRSSVPAYYYEDLQKGVNCPECGVMMEVRNSNLFCYKCGLEEKVEQGVIRTIQEFELLFPNRRVTRNVIFDWCAGVVSMRRIQRILTKNYRIIGYARGSYYLSTKKSKNETNFTVIQEKVVSKKR